MKVVKNLLAASTILLLLVASYMRLTDTVVKGRYSTGRSHLIWHTGFDSGNSVFLCALLTGAVWGLVVWADRQKT